MPSALSSMNLARAFSTRGRSSFMNCSKLAFIAVLITSPVQQIKAVSNSVHYTVWLSCKAHGSRVQYEELEEKKRDLYNTTEMGWRTFTEI